MNRLGARSETVGRRRFSGWSLRGPLERKRETAGLRGGEAPARHREISVELGRKKLRFAESPSSAWGRGSPVRVPSGTLFLEATQLKTAPTGRFTGLSGEKTEAEVQAVGTGTRR